MSTERFPDPPVTDFNDPRSRRINDFCFLEQISLTQYYSLQRAGRGPEELRPAAKTIRITRDAHVEWRERMRQLGESETAKLEVERQRELARIAGQKSAASDKHVSKNPRPRHSNTKEVA
jgi:hypothetical protein